MTHQECYNILGVSQNATEKEVKSAYRKLAQQHHPDKNGGDDTQFKRINEAYSILSGKQQTQQSHQHGSRFDWGEIFGGMGFDPFGFGFRRQQKRKRERPQPIDNSDIKVNSSLTLEQILKGAKTTVKAHKKRRCDKCQGRGGDKVEECSNCGATGEMESRVRHGNTFYVGSEPCVRCNSEGYLIQNVCGECHGQGVIAYTENYEIEVKGKKRC